MADIEANLPVPVLAEPDVPQRGGEARESNQRSYPATERSDTEPSQTDSRGGQTFPSESGHWYDPKTGKQVELPPRTRAKTAIKKGYVPGVTAVQKLQAKYGLERWKINKAIDITWGIAVSDVQCGGDIESHSIEYIRDSTWERLDAESEAVTQRGKELHAAIEQWATSQHFDDKWLYHIACLERALVLKGIDLRDGSTEHSFATERYGGKIDWHNDKWLLDFKSKERLYVDGKLQKLAYPEQAQQLAAYADGLNAQRSAKFMMKPPIARCCNVFVGVEDASVHIHEWDEAELLQGWREFECLLNFWWTRYEKP
jgi:hypothetical protein